MYLNCYQKFCTFSSIRIRINRNNVNFGDRKIKKVTFTKTRK